ncbi:MAG: thiolase family protein [Limibaculum sp.]
MTDARPIILGGGVTPFGRHRGGAHWRDWVRQAGADALADAGLEAADIDAVVVASESDFLSLQVNPGPVVLDELGLTGRPIVRVEGGGASGGLALREAMAQIMAGMARRILVVGFEAAAGHLDPGGVQLIYSLSFDAEVDGMAGATAVALYALSIAEHMERYGTTAGQMAHVSVKNHGNAVGNPWAHKPMTITIDDVLASPMVATPYRRFDCSLASDGAAAIVLAHPDAAPRAARSRSRITGSGLGSDFARLGDRAQRHGFRAKRRAAEAAYAMAGIEDAAGEIDVAEVCDPFTGAEIQSLEALGLAPPGAAAAALADGAFDGDGTLPINLSGGLIGQGGAPGATGIAQAVTMDRLLGGRYRDGAVGGDFHRGLIDVHGGVGTLAAVHVLERVEP